MAKRLYAPIIVPSTALDVRPDGQYVAIVGSNNTVHFAKVEIAKDNGSEVEVTSGRSAGQKVILEPTDDIKEGRVVSPVMKEQDLHSSK